MSALLLLAGFLLGVVGGLLWLFLIDQPEPRRVWARGELSDDG